MQRLRDNLGKKILALVLGFVFAVSSLFISAPIASAIPNNPNNPVTTETTETTDDTNNPDSSDAVDPTTPTETTPVENEVGGNTDACFEQVGAISWLVCPTSGFVANIIDTLYEAIEDFLIIKPLTSDENSPIRIIWEYARNISNIVFIVFLLIVIYSQITGLGISNYGIKRTLPRIIIAALLVNLSFFICSLAIDVSNVVGASVHGLYESVSEAVIANGAISPAAHFSVSELFSAVAGGAVIAGLAIATTPIGGQLIFMLIPVLIGILVAVTVGLFTISLRQSVIALLVMISPLAFVAYLLPNTEKWFKKWLDIFQQMLIFYPMFALLFWASRLAGWALITSATSWLGVILGVAVQIAPLFLAVSLMKMSGTILGKVNNALSQIGNRATGGVHRWTSSMRENRRQRYYAQSKMPYARLQRYMDYRAQLREINTQDAKTLRAGLAMERAQRRIARGYNPDTYDKKLRANSYARTAKRASNAALAAQTAKTDTSHVLENYSDFYKRRRDQKLGATSAKNWIEYNRAEFTRISDEEAGFDYLVDQYLGYMKNGIDEKTGKETWQYKRYINSAAGKRGATGVMGQLIAKANAVEQRKRRDDAILLAKYGYDKRSQRNMMVGYYIDDDGYATDEYGKVLVDDKGDRLDKYPGYLLAHDPSQLKLWNVVDENGRPYYNWKDKDGNFLMRIYKDDSAFTKEVLSNWDIAIGDPINDVYAILAGHKDPGELKDLADKTRVSFKDKESGEPISIINQDGDKILNSIGLSKYSATIGRALISSGYKSNAAYAGPMAAQSIGQSHIKNYVQLNVERLDNIIKSVKPGNFNTQNPAEINHLAEIMDPDLWGEVFNSELLVGRLNINGEEMGGLSENGKKVSPADATADDRMRLLKQKYLFPAASKMSSMMSRITQQVLDNQKPGAADAMKNLAKSLQKWQDKAIELGLPALPGDKFEQADANAEIRSPYLQESSFANISQDINNSLIMPDEDGNLVNARRNHRQRNQKNHTFANDIISLADTGNPNILVDIDNIYARYDSDSTSDVDSFLQQVTEFLDGSTDYRLRAAANDIAHWSEDMVTGGYSISDAHDSVIEIISSHLSSY